VHRPSDRGLTAKGSWREKARPLLQKLVPHIRLGDREACGALGTHPDSTFHIANLTLWPLPQRGACERRHPWAKCRERDGVRAGKMGHVIGHTHLSGELLAHGQVAILGFPLDITLLSHG